jgi:hypothetical protein
MPLSHRRIRVVALVVALTLLGVRAPFAASTLPHLRGIEEVRDWFNSGKGHVRLILLLSPT